MYRTKTCGELRLSNVSEEVTLAGWVQRVRKMGGMTFIDLRDRYGITQLVTDEATSAQLNELVEKLGREFVIQATGIVMERQSKNPKIETGDIEIKLTDMKVLNPSVTPPFTIEDESDGGEELRAKFRYLDLRRNPLKRALYLRHKMAHEVRNYLDSQNFIEIETPYLIKSTPEGARDFVVPSRMNPGEFYALPQSPQQQKQLLMVAGYDRYFQIVRCFRDEDLRADRQPEFTQIDCEMSFVERDDVLNTFEGMIKSLFKNILGIEINYDFPRMPYSQAMSMYGSDKPDIRFGMTLHDITDITKGHNFSVFDSAEYIGSIVVKGASDYTRKQLDELTEWVKRPQIGAKGLVYVKCAADGSFKSSIDKFFTAEDLSKIAQASEAEASDLILILSGPKTKMQTALGSLRIEMGNRLGLRDPKVFAPLWVVDFPLLEWDDETQRFYAMHHPFTKPKDEDIPMLDSDTGNVRANAYAMVINGVELGGGSLRIYDPKLQDKMFELLGFTEEKAQDQFGFLMEAFKYGAPPHAGLAFGFDRFVSMLAGLDSIRDTIAFPKNNSGRDMMNDAPGAIDDAQLDELYIKLDEERIAALKQK